MPVKILLVEDEPPLLEALARGLRRTGFEVVEAANGDNAIEVIDEGLAYEVLVTDVQMPGKANGAKIVEHALWADTDIPIVIMSADIGDIRLPPLGRQSAFLPKPFSIPTLVFLINGLLEMCRSNFHAPSTDGFSALGLRR